MTDNMWLFTKEEYNNLKREHLKKKNKIKKCRIFSKKKK